MRRMKLMGAACAALAMAACDGGNVSREVNELPSIDSISVEDMEALAGKKIFFGHQSVGWNIIDGLKDIAREKGWSGFDFIETRTPATAPGFYHAAIGQNGDPIGKIRDFESIMRSGMGNAVDIAFMKFCYVDFDKGTDVQAVFTAYRETMARLGEEFPKTRFMLVTAPLEAPELGKKAWIKRMLGLELPSTEGNVIREQMNSLIRTESRVREAPLFDVAKIESTELDGSRIKRSSHGRVFYSLVRDYTTDGGHLNDRGRLYGAVELMEILKEI